MKQQEKINYLQALGFATNPLNKKVTGLSQVWEYFLEIDKLRGNLKYNTDGLVVKLNDSGLVENLGTVGKTPRGWCALKYPGLEVTSKLVGVTWQVGRTGKLTPVANLEPVELQGSIVSRATIHNYREFINYNFSIGDILVIRKAGDIIPEIIKVIKI